MDQPEVSPIESSTLTPYQWLVQGTIVSITQFASVLDVVGDLPLPCPGAHGIG